MGVKSFLQYFANQLLFLAAARPYSGPPLCPVLKRLLTDVYMCACRLSIAITTLLLILGAAFFWLGRWFCQTQPDYREVEAAGVEAAGELAAEEHGQAPLLQNGHDEHAADV